MMHTWPRICAGCQLDFHRTEDVDAISVATEREMGEEVICEDCYIERKAMVARITSGSMTGSQVTATPALSYKSGIEVNSVRSASPVPTILEPQDIYSLTRNRLLYHEGRHYYRDEFSESPPRRRQSKKRDKLLSTGKDSALTKKLINMQLGGRVKVQTTDGTPHHAPSPQWRPNTLSVVAGCSTSPPPRSITPTKRAVSTARTGSVASGASPKQTLSYADRWRNRKQGATPPRSVLIDTSLTIDTSGPKHVALSSTALPLKERSEIRDSGSDYICKPLPKTHWKFQLFLKSLRGLVKRRNDVAFTLIGVTDLSCPLLESDYLLRQDDDSDVKERTVFHGTHERLFEPIFTHGLLPASHPDNVSDGPSLATPDAAVCYVSSDVGNAAKYANCESQSLLSWQYARSQEPQAVPLPTTVKVLGLKLLTPAKDPNVHWNERDGEWMVRDPGLLCPQFILHLQLDQP